MICHCPTKLMPESSAQNKITIQYSILSSDRSRCLENHSPIIWKMILQNFRMLRVRWVFWTQNSTKIRTHRQHLTNNNTMLLRLKFSQMTKHAFRSKTTRSCIPIRRTLASGASHQEKRSCRLRTFRTSIIQTKKRFSSRLLWTCRLDTTMIYHQV
jgi:hypothetical protein